MCGSAKRVQLMSRGGSMLSRREEVGETEMYIDHD